MSRAGPWRPAVREFVPGDEPAISALIEAALRQFCMARMDELMVRATGFTQEVEWPGYALPTRD